MAWSLNIAEATAMVSGATAATLTGLPTTVAEMTGSTSLQTEAPEGTTAQPTNATAEVTAEVTTAAPMETPSERNLPVLADLS